MSTESVGLLRVAAAVAPTVLPGPLGEAAAAWLIAEAECHEAVPEVSDSAGRVLSSIAEEISGEEVEVDFSVTVSTLDKAVGFAREVLALAEQQPATADDVVEAVAEAMWSGPPEWGNGVVESLGHADRYRSMARAAIAAMQLPGGILNPAVQDVRLTPDELAAVEARFKAQRGRPPTVLGRPGVTRAQVRAAATALHAWNNELPDDPRFVMHHVTGGVDREPNGALIDEVLHHLGITVQEGPEHE